LTATMRTARLEALATREGFGHAHSCWQDGHGNKE